MRFRQGVILSLHFKTNPETDHPDKVKQAPQLNAAS